MHDLRRVTPHGFIGIKLRRKGAAHQIEIEQGLAQHRKLWRDAQIAFSGDALHFQKDAPHLKVLQVRSALLVDEVGEIALESEFVIILGTFAHFFRDLRCTYAERKSVYGMADAYLCLSLSEGGSFALSDAEATTLPVVMTDVGNFQEYSQSRVIPWQQRDDIALVKSAIDAALSTPRGPSFFETWTFEKWRRAWREQIEQVADVKQREPALAS